MFANAHTIYFQRSECSWINKNTFQSPRKAFITMPLALDEFFQSCSYFQ